MCQLPRPTLSIITAGVHCPATSFPNPLAQTKPRILSTIGWCTICKRKILSNVLPTWHALLPNLLQSYKLIAHDTHPCHSVPFGDGEWMENIHWLCCYGHHQEDNFEQYPLGTAFFFLFLCRRRRHLYLLARQSRLRSHEGPSQAHVLYQRGQDQVIVSRILPRPRMSSPCGIRHHSERRVKFPHSRRRTVRRVGRMSAGDTLLH